MEIKGYKDFYKQDKLSIYNMDNMELMKQIPDKYFDLAIVDPPYGIKRESRILEKKDYKDWDNNIPPKEYFLELFRVSKEQIIWGGNYFIEFLYNSRCFLIWDKVNITDTHKLSMAEFAWTSFDSVAKTFYSLRDGNHGFYSRDKTIHPTQKPISLYSWILEKYAKEGMKIFDSHLGSGSNAIASHYAKMEFIGCELDSDYYNDSVKRIRENTKQLQLF